jgi:RimJ/RimL family protein N-acetyltransferase
MTLLRKDVKLTPLTVEHAPTMYRWMLDPAVRENIGLSRDPSMQATIDWLENAQKCTQILPFAILLGDQHVGNVVLDRIDSYLSSARFSIYIGEPSARGKGIGLTSTYLILKKGFSEQLLNKIWLTVHSRNYAAINTYTTLGFVIEGILRDEFWLNGKRIPVFYMGLLRAEFNSLKFETEILSN